MKIGVSFLFGVLDTIKHPLLLTVYLNYICIRNISLHDKQIFNIHQTNKYLLVIRFLSCFQASFGTETHCTTILKRLKYGSRNIVITPPPHPPQKLCALQGCDLEFLSQSPLSVIAGGGMLTPTAFTPLSISSVFKIDRGGGGCFGVGVRSICS